MSYWVQGQIGRREDDSRRSRRISRTFDVEDRYDVDGDGNFREPDGFIDHFQIVHAGGDQAAGDPHQGTDAIWSHRRLRHPVGPGGLIGFNAGSNSTASASAAASSRIDNPTGIWVGDYTIQPENGGLGVFAHEYGHDLGLPDLYDTSGNTGGAENNTAFWTLMSVGREHRRRRRSRRDRRRAVDLGAWDKLQLGWARAYDAVQRDPGRRQGHVPSSARPATARRRRATSPRPCS